MDRDSGKDDRLPIHRGADHSSPYPVSRLAPSFGLVDLAREIEQADQIVSGRLGAQLEVIAHGDSECGERTHRLCEIIGNRHRRFPRTADHHHLVSQLNRGGG